MGEDFPGGDASVSHRQRGSREGVTRMAGTLDGKVALVTGGSTGIGKASALAFAREGARVVVGDTNAEEGKLTVDEIVGSSGEAIFVRTDVSSSADVENLIRQATEAYGRLDCAFNNAGIIGSIATPSHEYSEEDWDRVIGVNLKGVWLCMKHEIPQMLQQGGGVIVNTSSIWGLVGANGYSAYVASKHAVAGLTKTAALEYIGSGIRINAVNPGPIETAITQSVFKAVPEMQEQIITTTPIGRMGEPREVAEAVVWLCSDAASYVVGHTLIVDGGWVAQ